MSLNDFYKLRRDFIIIGLTGKMQAGAEKFCEILDSSKKQDVLSHINDDFRSNYRKISDSESRKLRRVKDFFNHDPNWVNFNKLEYKNVVLLFILHQCYHTNSENFVDNICNWIIELGTYKTFQTERFGKEDGLGTGSTDYINSDFRSLLKSKIEVISTLNFQSAETVYDFLSDCPQDFFFSQKFDDFATSFFAGLDSFSIFLRHKLIHITSYCLRRFGALKIETIKQIEEDRKDIDSLKDIYIIAKVINRLIKIHRTNNNNKAHIIIDRLKNSYEIMYFRERYSGFYLVAANRDDIERKLEIKEKVEERTKETDLKENYAKIIDLDDTEYKIGEFKKGYFDSFDIENCVQKADYHLWCKDEFNCCDLSKYKEAAEQIDSKQLSKTNRFYVYLPLEFQILKFLSLIQQPGLITPTYVERTMQIAYNAKLNSGCISRQVGAVVTDSSFSVKGIGWNDVPNGQTPCSLRDLRDFKEKDIEDLSEFTNYEKGKTEVKYTDNEKFYDKLKADISSVEDLEQRIEGRSCAYCFKTFHNVYEGKENQVHTRSLHAEENAMMQISKNGGQGLYGGNLFTTASPCELCAKKAFQLGLKNIFFIDLYPGISQTHILEGSKSQNPNLFQFQGAIGRGYNKLYEPFMSIKDETFLRSGIKPSSSPITHAIQIKDRLKDHLQDDKYSDLKKHLDAKSNEDVMSEIVELLNAKFS